MTDSDALNFAVMCEGTTFSNWMADCIENLLEIDDVNLALLIVEEDNDSESGENSSSGLSSKIATFNRYRKRTNTKEAIDFATFFYYKHLTGASIRPNEALETRDLSGQLDGADEIECSVEEDGFSEYFHEDDIETIESYELDFILRDAFGIIRGDILEVPEYGVWSFHHQNEQKYRGSPPGLWEIIEGDPVTGAILQRLTERLDGGIILRRGFFRTSDTWSENINHVFYGTAEWPAQVALDILAGNDEYVSQEPSSTDAPIYRNPGAVDLLKLHKNKIQSNLTQLQRGRDNWNIGVVETGITDFVGTNQDLDVNWFPTRRRDGFIADPFFAEIDGQRYIFVEEYSYESQKGVISHIEYPDGFEAGTLQHAHEEEFHLSYPYTFSHDGAVYCTPEMHSAGEVRLYRLESPDEWKVETTLIDDIEAAEPTIFYHDNRWWLFFTKSNRLYDGERYQHTKLFVYHSPELSGEWEPHYNNPVKTDVRSSRPAGTPFEHGGDLFRPAQNCATGYGKKTTINKVTDLTTTTYDEEIVGELTPGSQYPEGTHHLAVDASASMTVIDGKRHIWDRDLVARKARNIYKLVFS